MTPANDEALKWQEVESNRRRMDQQKQQPLLDCLKVLGPNGLRTANGSLADRNNE
jgi:hypothetical protein